MRRSSPHYWRPRRDPKQARFDGASPLFIAARWGRPAIITALLEAKADPKQARTFDGASPLWIAAQEGQEMSVTALLEAKVDPNKTTTPGSASPLWIAAYWGRPAIVTALLAAKADPEQAAMNGKTPFNVAIEEGHQEIIDLFLNRAIENEDTKPSPEFNPKRFKR